MDLAPLTVDPEDARQRLDAYVALRADERTAEDEAIAAGYRAAARGHAVISLPDAIHAGGYFGATGLPRIAIARADAKQCWLHSATLRDGAVRWTYSDTQTARGLLDVARHRVVVRTPGSPEASTRQPWVSRTIVPIVPPQFRPRAKRLWRFHVLWEVERWATVAPEDPALVRHIRGDLWAVVATWDLTPLERAVLSARATS